MTEHATAIRADAIELTTPLGRVSGVAPPIALGLSALGLTNVGKLVVHLPMRYEKEEAEATIEQLQVGSVVNTTGEVTSCRVSGFGKRRRFEAVLADDTGRLELVWFNMPYLAKRIGAGTRLKVQGTLTLRDRKLQIANARWWIVGHDDAPSADEARLRPVYPASERVKSREIERIVGVVLPRALTFINDHLSDEYRREREMPSLADAYRMVHSPKDEGEIAEGRRRLAYDEFLLLQLGVQLRRAHLRRELTAPALRHDEAIDARIRERFAFTLTRSQDRVVRDIAKDLSGTVPTNRLIQGDVGAGKTVVALYALLMAVASGHQGALMAPTELLAEQHFAGISRTLEGSGVKVALLTGSLSKDDRASLLRRVGAGEIDIVIGTHALITGAVEFASLGVVVIDEQHRFGVHQRATLRTKGTSATIGAAEVSAVTPHVLVMTATPIPRTLAMTVFGDLDVSTIDALPPGRTPIETVVFSNDELADADGVLVDRLRKGERGFVVVPTIEGEEAGGGDELAGVREEVGRLERGPLAEFRVAGLHGRLKRDQRDTIMERFRLGMIDCLVATTVIEVGVDVPEATVMVVHNAERFGLAQLHQLRGRVGRGDKASICALVGSPSTEDGKKRLEAMASTTSGFTLAEKDLEIRGMGELFGEKQSGLPPFTVADLSRDWELLRMARDDAEAWLDTSPKLATDEDTLAKRRVLKRYGAALGIGDVG
ncbi:MAG: ATP-dependent DNA helicase RecG [Planctomycetota bacterium]